MDFAFPSFTRASTDLPYTQPPQKSLLELVIEAKGRLGLVPKRKLQKRNPATAFSAFSDSDDDDDDGDGEGGRGKRRARGNGDDMDAEESTYELTTRTAWVPPAYLLDHFFSRQFMSAYLTLHGIASSRAAGALAPPLLSVRDAQLHPMVESALCAVLREAAAPQTRGGGAGFYAGGSGGHGGEWSGQQGAWYGSSSSSRGSRGGRGGRGSHSRGGRHRGGGGNAGGYDAEAAQPSFSPAAGAVAPWDLARLEELGDAVFGNNGPAAAAAADSADSAAASRVLFRGLQQVALPALLLGDHVMLSGPRGVGKRTALLLAAGANALTAAAAAKAERASSGEPSEAESSGDGEGVEAGKEEAEAAQEDPTAAADEASEAPSTQAAVKRESDLDREEGPPVAPARPLHTPAASATTDTAAPGVDAAPDTAPRALFVVSSYAEVTATAQWLQRVFGPDAFVPYTFMRDEARLCPLVDAAASAGGLSDTAGASRPAFVSPLPSVPPGMAGGGAVGVAGTYLAPPAAARPLLPLITAADPTQAGVAGVLETPPSAGVFGAAGGPDLSELTALVLDTPLPNAAALASAAAAAATGPVEQRVEGSREDITREDRKRRRSPRSPSDSRSRDSDSARRHRRRHRHHRSRYDDDDRYDSDDDYRRERKERERRSKRRSDRHRSDHGESYSRSSRSHRRSNRDRRGSYDSADESAADSRHDSGISRTDRRTRSHRDRDERRERRESRRDRDDSRSRSRRHHRHRDTRDRRGSYSDGDKSEGERRERSRRHRRHRSSSSSSSSSSSIRRHRRHGDRRDRSSEKETREVAGATAEGVLGDVAVTALAFPAASILSDSLTANAAGAALGSEGSHYLGTMVDASAAATANAAVDATASLSSPFSPPPAAAAAVTEAGVDLPPVLAQRLPVLLTTYHGLQAAMDMVGGAASALPPLEHVRTAVFTGLDRVLAPPLKDTFPHVWWVSLVNALDVECQFMVSADRSGREVLGFLNSTVLPDAGERLLHLTQRDLAIWALMDVQVHPVPVEAAPTTTTSAAAAARDDGAGRGADGANQRRDGREGGERRDQRRPKISGTDIDAAKLTQLFTLLSEDRAAHATAHAAVAEAGDAADPTAASAGVSSSSLLHPASSSSASLQHRTASFSMEAPWQAVVLCSNRREQSLVVSQLASLFRDEAEALNGTPALLTDAVDVFRGGGADVLVLTDAQLSDARVLRDLHPCTGIRVLVHFSLPRSVMVQLEKAEVAEVLAQRGRAVLGHSRPFCSRRWWRQQPQQQPSSAAVVGQEFAPAKVPCWVMLTEHNMKSRIGTCVQEVLSEMADI